MREGGGDDGGGMAAERAAARAVVGATAAVAASDCRSGQVRVLGNHFLSFFLSTNDRNWGGARNLASISFFNVVSCPPAPAGDRKLERGGAKMFVVSNARIWVGAMRYKNV